MYYRGIVGKLARNKGICRDNIRYTYVTSVSSRLWWGTNVLVFLYTVEWSKKKVLEFIQLYLNYVSVAHHNTTRHDVFYLFIG